MKIFQSAYKQLHSTETALLKVFNDIFIDIDRNRTVIFKLLLLDLSTAFDTVDHLILLNRLANRFGICGSALTWFESYLSGRFHFVSIRRARSATASIVMRSASGVRDGTNINCFYVTPRRLGISSDGTVWVFILTLMTPSCTCLSIP